MELHDACSVLGVSVSMSRTEIRSAYQQIMRNHHPDVSSAPESQEIIRRASQAWEVLQKIVSDEPKNDSRFAVPTLETEVQVGDFWCKLITTTTVIASIFGDYESKSHLLKLPLAYCEQNTAALRNGIIISDDEGNRLFNVVLEVIDSMGHVVFTSHGSYDLSYSFDQYRRGLKASELEKKLVPLRRRLDDLPLSKKPSGHQVFTHMRDFERAVSSYRNSSWKSGHWLSQAEQLLRRIDREIDRLAASDPVELAVERLFDDESSLLHRHNLDVVRRINAASVRTGGFIEPYSRAQLEAFYRGVLEQVDDPLKHLLEPTLRLSLGDYADPDIVDDPELEPAPLQVELQANKGTTMYEVTYHYEDETPVASVTVPLKVYERIAPEHGKKHRFPELPHSIVWEVVVTFDGKVIAQGRLDVDLTNRVDKRKKGLSRSKHADESGLVGDFILGHEVSEVPPWYVGKGRPGRRR